MSIGRRMGDHAFARLQAGKDGGAVAGRLAQPQDAHFDPAGAVDDESGRQAAAIGDGAGRHGRRGGGLAAAAGLGDPGQGVHARAPRPTGRQGEP